MEFLREEIEQFASSMEYRMRMFDGEKTKDGLTYELCMRYLVANVRSAGNPKDQGHRLRSLVDVANFAMMAAEFYEEGCDEGRPAPCLFGAVCLNCCDPEACM